MCSVAFLGLYSCEATCLEWEIITQSNNVAPKASASKGCFKTSLPIVPLHLNKILHHTLSNRNVGFNATKYIGHRAYYAYSVDIENTRARSAVVNPRPRPSQGSARADITLMPLWLIF